jgi:hypothetical protein
MNSRKGPHRDAWITKLWHSRREVGLPRPVHYPVSYTGDHASDRRPYTGSKARSSACGCGLTFGQRRDHDRALGEGHRRS